MPFFSPQKDPDGSISLKSLALIPSLNEKLVNVGRDRWGAGNELPENSPRAGLIFWGSVGVIKALQWDFVLHFPCLAEQGIELLKAFRGRIQAPAFCWHPALAGRETGAVSGSASGSHTCRAGRDVLFPSGYFLRSSSFLQPSGDGALPAPAELSGAGLCSLGDSGQLCPGSSQLVLAQGLADGDVLRTSSCALTSSVASGSAC